VNKDGIIGKKVKAPPVNCNSPSQDSQLPQPDGKPDSKPPDKKNPKQFHTRPTDASDHCLFESNVYFHKDQQRWFFPSGRFQLDPI
jgi:hypothetical protein